jgi:hypothetical protein
MSAKSTKSKSDVSSGDIGRRCWVVALDCEARPLIQKLRMRRCEDFRGWPVYANQDRSDWLIVSGIGRVASAAAVGFLGGIAGPNRQGMWWNVGIAGHRSLGVGELRRAGKVIDIVSGRDFYPMSVAKGGPAAEIVTTVDVPGSEYPQNGMVEMEASGFCAAATRLTSRERIQVLKVISDNAERPFPKKPDPRMAEGLVAARVEEILAAADALRALDAVSSDAVGDRRRDRLVALVTEKVRMSVTQKRQLERGLDRWQSLAEDDIREGILDWVSQGANAGEILRRIESELSENTLNFRH